MHTNLNVSVFEFDRRSVRPNLEFAQLIGRHVLQCTYPLSGNQEAGIAARDNFDGIPLGDVADSVRLVLPKPVSGVAQRREQSRN
jgi:hypothetical protein